MGYGLFICYERPLIVNVTTVLGNNATYRSLNDLCKWQLSGRCNWRQCIYWPNVFIINHVKIGDADNATIGAGSVVTKDIPDKVTAVGNYAKVIHYNNAGNSVNKRWLNYK